MRLTCRRQQTLSQSAAASPLPTLRLSLHTPSAGHEHVAQAGCLPIRAVFSVLRLGFPKIWLGMPAHNTGTRRLRAAAAFTLIYRRNCVEHLAGTHCFIGCFMKSFVCFLKLGLLNNIISGSTTCTTVRVGQETGAKNSPSTCEHTPVPPVAHLQRDAWLPLSGKLVSVLPAKLPAQI